MECSSQLENVSHKSVSHGFRRSHSSFSGCGKIAYLLSQYPAVSHTFFLNEVIQLRALGLDVETASINSAGEPSDGFPQREDEEAARTFYIKAKGVTGSMGALARILLWHPTVAVRGLCAALALDPWNPRAMLYALCYWAEALIFGNWVKSRGCTHLHVHFGGPVATVCMLTAISWNLPYSLTVHGPDELYNVDRFYLKEKIQRAKFIICISDFCRSQLLRLSPAQHWEKFHVCRLGVDEEMFQPAHITDGEIRVVSVGRLHPSKGHRILLEALVELNRLGRRVNLDIVGEGTDRDMLQSYIDQQSLSDQVTLHGALSHTGTRKLLMKAHLFVLASFAEGVPVALMEAMAMEIACVATFVAGVPELIRDGVDGLLVSPSSVPQLTAALERLIGDPELRERLAVSGRAQVFERYNLRENVFRLAQTFSTGLREHHGE